ncbi:hypothetical protein ZWY2020_054688 [Hordeum vulgare]|nr:hypothetical protein ZWY2020_054688 [Hordeum vulgare]
MSCSGPSSGGMDRPTSARAAGGRKALGRRRPSIATRTTVASRAAAREAVGDVGSILNRNGSGLTLFGKETDAHHLFIELDEKKKPFTLMHCYIEFEKYPKWQTRLPPQKKHKKTLDASPGTTSNDEDFDVCTDALEEEIRPLGTKKDKKERLLKDSDCKLSLESVWAQKIEKDDAKETTKNALLLRAFELQEKRIALQERRMQKQFEYEEKIMLMDTSGMTDAQKQFYKKKQDEIAARCQNTSG